MSGPVTGSQRNTGRRSGSQHLDCRLVPMRSLRPGRGGSVLPGRSQCLAGMQSELDPVTPQATARVSTSTQAHPKPTPRL
jgi:hypothetical protein